MMRNCHHAGQDQHRSSPPTFQSRSPERLTKQLTMLSGAWQFNAVVRRGGNRGMACDNADDIGRSGLVFAVTIMTALTLRVVFRVALSWTAGLISSIIDVVDRFGGTQFLHAQLSGQYR
jgi:hypothetical protein